MNARVSECLTSVTLLIGTLIVIGAALLLPVSLILLISGVWSL